MHGRGSACGVAVAVFNATHPLLPHPFPRPPVGEWEQSGAGPMSLEWNIAGRVTSAADLKAYLIHVLSYLRTKSWIH